MRNFLYRMQNAMSRFMYGRNGMDQLNQGLFILYLVLFVVMTVVRIFTRSGFLLGVMNFLMTLLAVLYIWRMFSRNLGKRREENRKYVAWLQPRVTEISARKARRQDKEHKYFVCSNCKTVCRVPVGKGKIEITCPKCGKKIRGRS